jgi:hypothetical protein
VQVRHLLLESATAQARELEAVRSRRERREHHITPAGGSLTFQTKLGVVAHAAIADSLAAAELTGKRPTLNEGLLAGLFVRHRLDHDRRRALLLIRSFVKAYLADYRLGSDWRLHSIEHPLAGGRIDLLFRRDDGAILGDELKTRHGLDGRIEPSDREQVARYVNALRTEFPGHFLGVRLILLGPPSHAHLITRPEDLSVLKPCRRPN